MTQFIPYNQEESAQLNHELSKTLFNNVENFIQFYNSGMIAKRSDEVTEIVKQVVDTYKNIEEKGGQLIFLSTAEVYLEEIIQNLEPWNYLVKIKREVEEARDEDELNQGTLLAFGKEDNIGYLLKLVDKDDKRVAERIGAEKIFTRANQIKPIFEKFSSVGQSDGKFYYFRASDFLNLDTGFIEKIYGEIPTV